MNINGRHSNLCKNRLTVFFMCWSILGVLHRVYCSSAQCLSLLLTGDEARTRNFSPSGGACIGPPSSAGGGCAALALRAINIFAIYRLHRSPIYIISYISTNTRPWKSACWKLGLYWLEIYIPGPYYRQSGSLTANDSCRSNDVAQSRGEEE